MELKAELKYPYSEIERINFIVEQNHNNGYTIEVDEDNTLKAYGPTVEELFAGAKAAKLSENDAKASAARYTKTFTVTLHELECEFDTTAQTQADLLTAFATCSTGATYTGWVCNNGVVVDLSLEDVMIVSEKFREATDVYAKWNEYRMKIEVAETVDDLDKIIIEY